MNIILDPRAKSYIIHTESGFVRESQRHEAAARVRYLHSLGLAFRIEHIY